MPSEKEKYDEWRKSMATRYVEKIKEDREKRRTDQSPSPEHDRKRDKKVDSSPDRDRKDKDKSRDRKSGREYSPERDRKRSPDRRRDEKESEKRFDDRDRRDRKRDDRDRGRSDRDRRDERESKRAKIEVKEETKSNGSSATGQKSKEEIEAELKMKEIMYQARMEIDERRKQWSITGGTAQPTQPSTSAKNVISLKPEEASVFIDVQMSKLNRLAELKNKLGSKLANVPVVPAMPAVALEHMAIEKRKPEPKPEPEPEILEYLDPRVKLKPAVRQRRTFEFKEPGEYQKLANMQRNKAKLEKLQSEISQAAKHTGISSAVKLAIVTPSGAEGTTSYVPNVEWWDEVVLHGKGYDSIPSEDMNPLERFADTISELVEHPVQLKPPDEPIVPQYLRAYLTKKEQKKLRRQNRRDVLKEKAEKVRLGLEKPPEPKVKISNLMRVLGNEAIQDPTKMEAFVRKQMAERLKKHKEENEARKLSKEQKSAKKIRKIAEDTSLAVHVSVYKAKSLLHPSKKFKVEMNAKQLQMTGAIILYEDINVIVVEGGPKQQKFYKNLMLNRIKWNDEIIGQKKEAISKDIPGERNDCTLIWEGIVKRRAFHDFRFHLATSHKHAREMLDKYGVAHYWDLCYSTSVLLTPEENT